MSSLAAVHTASASVPTTIVHRTILHSGPIVRIKVPSGALAGVYMSGENNVPFIQFSRNIRGGRVNLFVHAPSDSMFGQSVTAKATVLKKTLEDGREFLYVDLQPVAAHTQVTHRLAVLSNNVGYCSSGDHLVFETPEPLSGLVIFVPPDAKVVTTESSAPLPVKALSTSKDSQLDRLLSNGWIIDSETPAQVNLSKMKGDQRKTMIHHRPRKSRE